MARFSSCTFAPYVLQAIADLFFLWVIFQYALGGWTTAQFLFAQIGLPAWIVLAIVCALVLYRSDYRTDVPLFIAAYALGYWGEWWGTTHGVWTYWNHATPPDYLPPLWAIGLLTVTHLRMLASSLVAPKRQSNPQSSLETLAPHAHLPFRSVSLRSGSFLAWTKTLKAASFVVLPALAFAYSVPRLAAVDWSGRLDAHFFAGIVAGIALLVYRIDIDETFGLYLCGMLLGGTYEWLGTWMGEWTYITHEVPPLWIIPLWGLACAAMVKLSRLLILATQNLLSYRRGTSPAKI